MKDLQHLEHEIKKLEDHGMLPIEEDVDNILDDFLLYWKIDSREVEDG